jgi:signal transduction histidine kinase
LNDDVNLKEVLQYELQQLQAAYPHIKSAVVFSALPTIKANKNQLQWMFHHLLKNAFDHGVTNNSLELNIQAVIVKENVFNSLEHKYKYVDYVKLSIKDYGPGFDARYSDYIFGVLKRLNLKADKLGFGLAFCKRIVENHFGNIKAEGQTGKGATFTITLPIDNLS